MMYQPFQIFSDRFLHLDVDFRIAIMRFLLTFALESGTGMSGLDFFGEGFDPVDFPKPKPKKLTKTQQFQQQIDGIEFLRGYTVQWWRHSYWLLTCPNRDNIYLQNSKVAEKWLASCRLTGRDNAALRRVK